MTTYRRLQETSAFWRTVPFQALHHPPLLEGYREPGKGDYILLPGRLHRWKRVHLVIEAFRHLSRDIQLKICGTGEDEATLRELAGHDDRIEFLGKVSAEQLLDLYAGALVVPFVPLHEDYGLITVEAFRSKKPVITCHDSGDPTYFVKDFQTGFVVEPRPEAIADRITYLVDHPDQAAVMGERGFEAIRHITWESVVEPILAAGRSQARPGAGSPAALLTSGQGVGSHPSDRDAADGASPVRLGTADERGETQRVVVLDMQPIDPPVGGGRIRLLGLYHNLGADLPTTYIGTYDWPGPVYRRHMLSDTLEEIDVPLSDAHFRASKEWQERVQQKTVIDVSFDLLAHHSPEFVQTARQHAAEADIVVFSHPWIYPLVKDVLRRDSQLVVYDSQNVEGLLRMILLDDGGFGTELVRHVVGIERVLCEEADLVLACSHEDARLFHEFYDVPFGKMAVVPNGTFTGRVLPTDEASRRAAKERLGLGSGPVALFVGSAYQPNVEAAEFIQRVLAPALPHVTFVICGGVGEVLQEGAGEPAANVRVTGFVDEDEKLTYFAAADLAVNPMFSGSGTNIKMFDFMAFGLPIVSTPIGARGIVSGGHAGFQVVPASRLVDAIRHILSDPAEAASLGASARKLAEERYAWERISADLGRLLRRLRERHRQPRPFFSVVIPSYERHEQLSQVVAALRRQSFRDFEVIIVDQSAQPWSGRDQQGDLDLLYIHTDVRGAAKARNTGARYARGQVIAFTDDDCQPLDDWLAEARPYFDDAGLVGVEGLIVSDRHDDPEYRAVTNEGFEGIGFMTANFFVRRDIFMMVDGFDESSWRICSPCRYG